MRQSCQYKNEPWIKKKPLPTLSQHYANHYCNSGPTLGQRNFEDILTLGQRCANMLGQRWDTLHLQRWPNIESQRWPNKVNNVGPTLGQRMRAVWVGIAKLECGTCWKLPNNKIHKCKVHDISENNSNRTISELDLCILVTNYWNFSKSKGHNCAENYSTGPKFKLNLRYLETHLLYTEFQFKMSICNGLIMSGNWKLMEFF